MIKQECIGIPDMILLLMIFCFKKIKIKAEIVLSPGGAYFPNLKHLKNVPKRSHSVLPKTLKGGPFATVYLCKLYVRCILHLLHDDMEART